MYLLSYIKVTVPAATSVEQNQLKLIDLWDIFFPLKKFGHVPECA